MEAMKAKANHETDWLPEMSELAPEGKAFIWVSTALLFSSREG